MAADLVNKAFSHSVTTVDSAIPFIQMSLIPDKDPFFYNTTMFCYTADCFLGIIINIDASKHSTAGYNQFLAF